jgi:Tfp pilus assembly protein PilF
VTRFLRLAPLWLLLFGGAVFGNAMDGVFVFDDVVTIRENPDIESLRPLVQIESTASNSVSGRPVVRLSLALNHALGGLDVRGYHAFNLGVHLLAALLVLGIVRRTLRGPGVSAELARSADGIGLAVGALWVVHPLVSECVDYVTQRTESMMALCLLGALYAAIRSREGPARLLWGLVAVAAGAVGMGCKESMAMAPLLVLAHDLCFPGGGRAAYLRARAPLHVGLFATLLLLVPLAGSRGGTVGTDVGVSSLDYFMAQWGAITHYLKLVFWPHPLVLAHGQAGRVELVEVLFSGIFVALFFSATLVTLRMRPQLGFLGVWFFLTLAPTSSFVPIVTEVAAERRMYLPLIAVVTAVVLAVHAFVRGEGDVSYDEAGTRERDRRGSTGLLFGLTVAAVVALGTRTFLRNLDYRDPVRIWETSVAARPGSFRAQYNLGLALEAEGRTREAIERYRASLDANPDYIEALNGLGGILWKSGRVEEAIVPFQHALRIDPDQPVIQSNLGAMLASIDREREAAVHLREAVRLMPDLADARYNLAKLLMELQEYEEAEEHLRAAVELRPGFEAAEKALAIVLRLTE